MNIIKEERKITLELSSEEDEVVNYFIQNRNTGTAVLHEYFHHWMQGRIETKRAEELDKLIKKYQHLTLEEKERMLLGTEENTNG